MDLQLARDRSQQCAHNETKSSPCLDRVRACLIFLMPRSARARSCGSIAALSNAANRVLTRLPRSSAAHLRGGHCNAFTSARGRPASYLTLLRLGQDHRHRLGSNGSDNGAGRSDEDAENVCGDLTLPDRPQTGSTDQTPRPLVMNQSGRRRNRLDGDLQKRGEMMQAALAAADSSNVPRMDLRSRMPASMVQRSIHRQRIEPKGGTELPNRYGTLPIHPSSGCINWAKGRAFRGLWAVTMSAPAPGTSAKGNEFLAECDRMCAL
jgi:hypothetical protein